MFAMPAAVSDVVFLDLDGCLVDSSVAIPNAMNTALTELGLVAVPAEVIQRLIGPPLEIFAAQLIQEVGGSPDQVEPFERAYLAHYAERMVEDSTVYDGISDALMTLAERARLVVVTLKRQALAERLVAELGLATYLTFIVGADGTERDKAPLLARAIERARPGRAVMIGDQPDDMTAALRRAIPGVGVGWGFGARADLIAAGASAIVDRPSELEAAIASVW
jgi:phosphoglycolate phosphatase